jgi:hypothetical protein
VPGGGEGTQWAWRPRKRRWPAAPPPPPPSRMAANAWERGAQMLRTQPSDLYRLHAHGAWGEGGGKAVGKGRGATARATRG